MKKLILTAAVLTLLTAVLPGTTLAADSADAPPMSPAQREKAMKAHAKKAAKAAAKEEKKKSTKHKSVPAAIEELEFLNGTPNKKAKFFIYLHSASWCTYCGMVMPKFVEQYGDMKKAKVEIILIGHDSTDEEVTQYIEGYEAEFAAIRYKNEDTATLPGFNKPAKGIPHATIVNRKGKVFYDGHANGALQWETLIKSKKK